VRYLIFALMIALLPLRGWVGDAMATQMAVHTLHQAGIESSSVPSSPASQPAPEAIAIKTIAASAGITWATGTSDHHSGANQPAAMPPDCQEHAAAMTTDGASTNLASTDASGACPDCAFCQACHTVALTGAEPNLAPSAHPSALPQPTAAQFASAEAALGQKPPIS
jgi:hypothetical protein